MDPSHDSSERPKTEQINNGITNSKLSTDMPSNEATSVPNPPQILQSQTNLGNTAAYDIISGLARVALPAGNHGMMLNSPNHEEQHQMPGLRPALNNVVAGAATVSSARPAGALVGESGLPNPFSSWAGASSTTTSTAVDPNPDINNSAAKDNTPTNTTRELFDLCYNADYRESEKAWRQLQQWLSFYQNDKPRFQEAAAYQNTFKWTPLHVLVSRSPPVDVVETLVKHAPETLRMKTLEGDLPLHIACGQRASPEIIKILVAAYPESVRVTNNAGGLPLHFACYNRHSLDVLNLLLQAYPESIHVECVARTGENIQPSELLKNKNQFDSEDKSERIFFLHKAVADGLSVHLVKLLIEAFPESCTIHDSNGMIPLHHACIKQRANGIAAMLLTASPKSETIEDSNGVTPSQLLKQAASRKDKKLSTVGDLSLCIESVLPERRPTNVSSRLTIDQINKLVKHLERSQHQKEVSGQVGSFRLELPVGFQPIQQSGPPGPPRMPHGLPARQIMVPSQEQQHPTVEFDHAINYVTKVKRRFESQPQIYPQFLEILHTFRMGQRGIKEVLEQVLSLFANHPDLLREFTYFVPDAAREQAKERLNRAAMESEARFARDGSQNSKL